VEYELRRCKSEYIAPALSLGHFTESKHLYNELNLDMSAVSCCRLLLEYAAFLADSVNEDGD
jgi:hypothetical protein